MENTREEMELIGAMMEDHRNGMTNKEIAEKYGIPEGAIVIREF